ncbi:hypothetical protein [Maricaulis maris]|uniref:hypothetical protein n=1 Tax=Maricaulis maris TaxID=74318 RepID=UPI00350E556D
MRASLCCRHDRLDRSRRWRGYGQARNDTLARCARERSLWFVVNADDKPRAGLNLMRCILSQISRPLIDEQRYPVDVSHVAYLDRERSDSSHLHS